MVTHIVFWALKDEAEGHSKRENAEHIKEMLEALVGVVPGLIEAKVRRCALLKVRELGRAARI